MTTPTHQSGQAAKPAVALPWTFNGESVLDSKGNNACTKANARLIAASPELLSALKACLNAMTDETGNVGRREADACLMARQAIFKATSNVTPKPSSL